MSLKRRVPEEDATEENNRQTQTPVSGTQPGIHPLLYDLLQSTNFFSLNRPNHDLCPAEFLYSISSTREGDDLLYYVIKLTVSRFQPHSSIALFAENGEPLFEIFTPMRVLHKIKVSCGIRKIGSITKSTFNMSGPRFLIRDDSENVIGTVESKKRYFCSSFRRSFGLGLSGRFEIKRKNPGSAAKSSDELIGTIIRDISYNDRNEHKGLLEIQLRKVSSPIEVKMKFLIIAAAIFIEPSVFVPRDGEMDLKVVLITIILMVFTLGTAIGVVHFIA